MHRTSITEALLGTAVLFNTVFHMPANELMIWKIFYWLIVFGILLGCMEVARDCEEKIRKERRKRHG